MKVLVTIPMLFDAKTIRGLPDGRVLVELASRRVAVSVDDVNPSTERQIKALAAHTGQAPERSGLAQAAGDGEAQGSSGALGAVPWER